MEEKKLFTPFEAGAFTINYVIGSGFLVLPWVFYQAGFILSLSVLAVITFFSIISVSFIIESSYRMARLEDWLSCGTTGNITASSSTESSVPLLTLPSHIKEKNLKISEEGQKCVKISKTLSSESMPLIPATVLNYLSIKDQFELNFDDKPSPRSISFEWHQYEIIDMCEFFLGPIGKYFYGAVLIGYMYGTLWAYSSVFAKAFSTISFLSYFSYSFYLSLFAVIVVPLSLLELTEQKTLQICMAVCRFLMLFFMLATLIISYHLQIQAFADSPPPAQTVEENLFSSLPLCTWNHLYILLPVAAYANIFHHSIPSLTEPIADKKWAVRVFAVTLLVCFVFYALVGVTVAAYFREQVKPASNLNWNSYVGSLSFAMSSGVPVYADLVASFVVLFPALDVASAFPLNAITLGNSLLSFYSPHEMVDTDESNHIFYVKKLFRLLAAVPPIIGALCISDLGKITDYTGITGFAIAFIFPALLALQSESRCRERGLAVVTPYSHLLSGRTAQYVCAGLGIFLCAYVTYSLLTRVEVDTTAK